jgi:hypothetical protein
MKFTDSLLITSLLLLQHFVFMRSDTSIRIVDGVDKYADSNKLPYIEPVSYHGPDSLAILNGLCFTKAFDRYEYQLCPFQNITSRRLTSLNQRPVLLGVWGHWMVLESLAQPADGVSIALYDRMKYIDGQICGITSKSVTLRLLCETGHDIEISKVEELGSCDFYMELALPFPCSILMGEAPSEAVISSDSRITTSSATATAAVVSTQAVTDYVADHERMGNSSSYRSELVEKVGQLISSMSPLDDMLTYECRWKS